jgi:serine/threonine protein kinase
MSPEALKRNIYSVKNDIWSIGIMLYELLHGETPWECKTEKELIEKMIRVPVRMRESLNLSEEMKQFVRKCLEVNEEQRMSLADLKEWNNNNSYESLAEGSMVFLGGLSLGKKPCSQKENGNVLSELTNRVSSRSQSSFGNTAKFGR